MAGVPAPAAAFSRRVDHAAVLDALADATLVLGSGDEVCYANAAAEQLLGLGRAQLAGRPLAAVVPPDSPLFAALARARAEGGRITEYDLVLETPRIGRHRLSLHAAALAEQPDRVVLSLRPQSVARRLDGQIANRSAARPFAAMAAMLAHEVKNPLSGVRGAAQLLEQGVAEADRDLTRLICEETDRIVALVERLEAFADDRPPALAPVNLHEVLDRVRRIAAAGFGRQARFEDAFDPSLPPALANRDLLIQVFLNLVKNAVEALAAPDGRITLVTTYRPGIRIRTPAGPGRTQLPLVVGVANDGPAIPEAIRARLFEPFVTTRAGGRGLGLALVAKLVADMGGMVEFDSAPGRTEFRVLLPVAGSA